MTILSYLNHKEIWEKFYQYKLEKSLLTEQEKKQFEDFICNEKYLDIANKIIQGVYQFSIPEKKLINKIDKSQKRAVYTYSQDEMMILKLLSYLLYKYDKFFPDNCYSFRLNYGVKQAIYNIIDTPNINELYGYKIDISNYFNSVPIENLLPKLNELLKDDTQLYKLFEQILTNKQVIENGVIIEESKGIMAGVPISSFLANLYLKDIDEYFKNENVLYARYSDDIILFGTLENIKEYEEKLKKKIKEQGLVLNTAKEKHFLPKEKWDFLGFAYENGTIDIAEITIKKIKGKIRRSSRAIRRWMLKKQAVPERALKAMNIKFNKKFYSTSASKELSWAKWYFPIINTSKSLKEIDCYMQQELRYIVTGKHNKKNYEKVPYQELRRCYYRTLVNEYYQQKE